MRPEPRDGVDISPRAEAGDQFFVEQAERKRAFETKPMPRPSMDKSFPNVKPKQRPEGQSEFITRGYEVDGREIQVGIIKFKGGEEIALDKVLQNIDTKGTADETPVLTERTILQVLDFIKEKNPTKEEFETYWYNKRLNKGGAMMNKQMEMAFMKQGGIKDDGMTKDPVSGNNIPPGSMATEVRDDIPAMLSEGEYVVPADVLRYYGVNFFENLRGQAKNGLQTMEQNGRIGGTPLSDQDVARNMQQPMMSPQPPQASNTAQPQQQMMANQGMMVQGFDNGTAQVLPNITSQYASSFSPATARYSSPMFQGTSSQLANIATAQQNNPNAPESITYMRTHYNKDGDTAQIQYTGTTPENAVVAPGQDQLLKDYPLTKAEYLAYKKGQGGGGGGGGGGGDTTPKGSDTTWMTEDGINWSDPVKVQAWATKTLTVDPLAQKVGEMGGMLAGGFIGVGIGDSIAKVRSAALVQRDLGNNEFADELEKQANEALAKAPLVVQMLEKLGAMTGKNYRKNFTITELDGKKVVLTENDPKVIKETERVFQNYASQVGEGIAAPSGGGTSDKDGYGGYTNQFTSYSGSDTPIVTQESIDDTSNILATTADLEDTVSNLDDVTDKIEDFTSGVNTSGQTGFDKGGLMAAPKKKKKRQPKKGGLAGKK